MLHALRSSARAWSSSSAPAQEHLTALTGFPGTADPGGAPELFPRQPVPAFPCLSPQPQQGSSSPAPAPPPLLLLLTEPAAPAARREMHRTYHYRCLIVIIRGFQRHSHNKLLSAPIFPLRGSFHVFLLRFNFARFAFTAYTFPESSDLERKL